MSTRQEICLLHLPSLPVHSQLQLEEGLLRLTEDNWCLINPTSSPAIVMGISGDPQEVVNLNKMKEAPIPLIRRYSGGGTVVIDHNTFLISFIFQKEAHPFPLFPEPILRWSSTFYAQAFALPGFHLRENDYVIGNHKCGGNAQYIQKHRFVHHTTFLWDFDPGMMDYLLPPKRAPIYRAGRSHDQFLCRLKDFFPSKEGCLTQIIDTLRRSYQVTEVSYPTIAPIVHRPHRTGSRALSTFDGQK